MTPLLPADPIIVERIADGDDRLLTVMFDKWRGEFEGVLRSCSDNANNLDYGELFQESMLILYNYIISGKIFVKDGQIHCMDRYNEIKKLKANLKTYLINVGKNKQSEEIRRQSRNVDILDRVHRDEDANSADSFDDDHFNTPRVDTSNVGNNSDVNDWVNEENEDETISLVRRIVKNMTDPCKTLFHYIYFGENGKRMPVKEIQKRMPQYTNEVSVRNQISRCHKKFKETFMKSRSII